MRDFDHSHWPQNRQILKAEVIYDDTFNNVAATSFSVARTF